jgi:hypothetical protein
MTATDRGPAIAFSVSVGPNDMPRLNLRIADREFPFDLTPKQAGDLGQALLAAAVGYTSGGARPPVGTLVERCRLPVMKWATGLSMTNGLPLLRIHIPGDIELVFKLTPQSAADCGTSLSESAAQAAMWAPNVA